jgi:hypothetical protein
MYTGIDYRVDFKTSSRVLFLRPMGLLFVPRVCSVDVSSMGSSIVKLLCHSVQNVSYELRVLIPENCLTIVDTYGAKKAGITEVLRPWRGIMVIEHNIIIRPIREEHTISIRLSCGSLREPIITLVIKDKAIAGTGIVTTYTMLLALFPLAVFSYFSLMTMFIVSVARLLGAVSPRVIFEL